MVLDTQGIGIFLFDITLFVLFCYHFKALIKRHILPFIHDVIALEQKRFHDLNKQKIMLSMEKENLSEQLQEQALQFDHFEKRVKLWYQSLRKKDQEQGHAL